jgi:hypothetical protein
MTCIHLMMQYQYIALCQSESDSISVLRMNRIVSSDLGALELACKQIRQPMNFMDGACNDSMKVRRAK